jgi:hypothetical protein
VKTKKFKSDGLGKDECMFVYKESDYAILSVVRRTGVYSTRLDQLQIDALVSYLVKQYKNSSWEAFRTESGKTTLSVEPGDGLLFWVKVRRQGMNMILKRSDIPALVEHLGGSLRQKDLFLTDSKYPEDNINFTDDKDGVRVFGSEDYTGFDRKTNILLSREDVEALKQWIDEYLSGEN